uniref:Uncharacterized protein n=1 Tax=Helianthus annuus TaxID=4232 RepID=A0A251RYA0_HELAN
MFGSSIGTSDIQFKFRVGFGSSLGVPVHLNQSRISVLGLVTSRFSSVWVCFGPDLAQILAWFNSFGSSQIWFKIRSTRSCSSQRSCGSGHTRLTQSNPSQLGSTAVKQVNCRASQRWSTGHSHYTLANSRSWNNTTEISLGWLCTGMSRWIFF